MTLILTSTAHSMIFASIAPPYPKGKFDMSQVIGK